MYLIGGKNDVKTKETKEEILDRVPEGTKELIDSMSDKVATDIRKAKKVKRHFYGKRNRAAYIRMNRPARIESTDNGLGKVFAFHQRALGILEYQKYAKRQRDTLEDDKALTDGDFRYTAAHWWWRYLYLQRQFKDSLNC